MPTSAIVHALVDACCSVYLLVLLRRLAAQQAAVRRMRDSHRKLEHAMHHMVIDVHALTGSPPRCWSDLVEHNTAHREELDRWAP